MLTTPVLLLIFNRPDTAQQSFDQIRNVKPQQLFIAADGPRPDKPEDQQKCDATRAIINQVDWECDLKTLFRDRNLGCGYGPAEAITWFFEQVEQGIILEDDCLATSDFFFFCQELLDKYKQDEQIAMISGTNPAGTWSNTPNSYVFSNMGYSWGWASWRRAWKNFDYQARGWATEEGKEKVRQHLNNESYYKHFAHEFELYFREVRNDVWDFQWLFCRLYHESYAIVPVVNLIANIGFDGNATHTFDRSTNVAHLPRGHLNQPLKHPIRKKVDAFFDWYIFERFISPNRRSVARKLLLKAVKSSLPYRINWLQ